MTAWLETLAGIVGPRHLMTDPDQLAPHCLDWRQRYQGRAVALARPGCTAEVAALVRACVAAGVPWCHKAATPRTAVPPPRTTAATR